jgi:alpha-D-ribose 1-methylphosphonate 5-triphosphate synthase subunit PhnL
VTGASETRAILAVSDVDKTFTMHLQGGQRLPVLRELAFEVHAGECVALGGASGAGKSSVLKMVYGNYAVDRGSIVLRAQGRVIDIAAAGPRQVRDAVARRVVSVELFAAPAGAAV